jgi:hypothetical protein
MLYYVLFQQGLNDSYHLSITRIKMDLKKKNIYFLDMSMTGTLKLQKKIFVYKGKIKLPFFFIHENVC